MAGRWSRRFVLTMVIAATTAGAALAAPSQPRLATSFDVSLRRLNEYYADPAVPNISGFWRPAQGAPREIYTFLDGTPLPPRSIEGQDGWPYRPEWQAVYDARRRADTAGLPYGDPTAACWPPGLYKAYIAAMTPFEITQTPGRVELVHERFTPVRRIFTDGRPHPKDIEPSLNGHSIGRWEGKTLVVDSIGLRKETTLSITPGLPHSDQLHVIEKFTRIDPITLRIEIILEDKKAMTRPVKTALLYKLWLNDGMSENLCEENNRNPPDANLVVQVHPVHRKLYGYDLPED